MAQTTKVSERNLGKVVDHLWENQGASIKEISEGVGRSISWATEAVRALIEKGLISKGVQKKIFKSGELSDKFISGYYVE